MKCTKILAIAVLPVMLAAPALAEKPTHAHKREKITWDDKSDKSGKIAFRIGSRERDLIRSFLKTNYGKHCPPGLAKKNNGCLPPGQAKKYRIGGVLGEYSYLPEALAMRLGPPPRGTFYAMVDKDVVLAVEGTKRILDAVTLLSAVGN